MITFDFNKMIELWEKIFWRHACVVRVYDENSIKNGVCKDFLDLVGLNPFNKSIEKIRISHSLFTEFVTLIDQSNVDHDKRQRIIKKLLSLSMQFKLAQIK